jgi:hypothetical protein
MSVLELLRKVLKKHVLVNNSSAECRNPNLILTETNKTTKLRKVNLIEFPDDKVILKPDKSLCSISSIFKSNQGECKNCDYIIITNINGKGYVFYVEMKSKVEEIVAKFKSSTCSINYISCVLEKFYNNNLLLNYYDHRYILFYLLPIGKLPTKPLRVRKNSSPDDALEYGIADGDDVPISSMIRD